MGGYDHSELLTLASTLRCQASNKLPTSEVVSPLEEQGISGNGNRFELLETYLAICYLPKCK